MPKTYLNFAVLLAEKEQRDRRRYSVRAVAELTGLNTGTVHNLLTNKTTRLDLGVVDRMCRFLDVHPSRVLIVEDERLGA